MKKKKLINLLEADRTKINEMVDTVTFKKYSVRKSN